MTDEGWREYVASVTGGEYECLSAYVNTRTKVRMRHAAEACRHEWDVAPTYFTQGVRCPKCANARKGKTREAVTLEQFHARLHAIYPEGEYVVVGTYVNVSTRVRFRHICGSEFDAQPSKLISPTHRTTCLACRVASQVWTHERFVEAMRGAGDGADEYVPLTEYAGYNSPILLRHVPSGAEWETTPNTFLSRGARYNPLRSPRSSSYHREAKRVLEGLGLAFEEEKSFPDLKSPFSGRPLWFDFWLPDRGILIEIDGELHWTAYGNGGDGTAYLARRQALDRVKDEWVTGSDRPRLVRIRPSRTTSLRILIEEALQ